MSSVIRCDICHRELHANINSLDQYYIMVIKGHNIDQVYEKDTGIPLRPELGTFHICKDCFPQKRFEQYLKIGTIYL